MPVITETIPQESVYKVKLENLFEGPMDLMVHLIRKNEINIYDIPVALITDQYLEYIDWMKSMNIDMAGEFLLMASTLTYIKSRMLLPVHEEEDEEEDPRSMLTRPLLEYLQIKSAAEQLSERPMLGEHTFVRKVSAEELQDMQGEPVIQVGLFELIDAFRKILDNISEESRFDLVAEGISVRERITEIVDILEEKGSLVFEELFEGTQTKNALIVTFLAILEMVKLRLVRVAQHVQSGIIRIFYE